MCTLIGDVILSAAFLTYCGPIDQSLRTEFQELWINCLESTIIPFRKNLSLPEYLSSFTDRLDWVSKGLPSDSLYLENAVIFNLHDRFPLVIDPSGQVR